MDWLNQKVRLRDGDAILVADEISEEEPSDESLLVATINESRYPLWARESDVTVARESHPDVPVHGFWHTVLANGAADLSVPLQLVPFDALSGLFLYCQDGVAVAAGGYAGGRLSYQIPTPLAEGVPLEIATTRWQRPAHAIRLPIEIMQVQRRRERAGAIRGAVLGLAAFLAFLGYGVQRDLRAAEQTARVQELRQAQTKLASALVVLERTRIPANNDWLMRRQALGYLLDLATHTADIELPDTALGGGFQAVANDLAYLPTWADSVEPLADGRYAVRWGAVPVEANQ